MAGRDKVSVWLGRFIRAWRRVGGKRSHGRLPRGVTPPRMADCQTGVIRIQSAYGFSNGTRDYRESPLGAEIFTLLGGCTRGWVTQVRRKALLIK